MLISGAGGGSGFYEKKNIEFIGGFGGPYAGDGVGQAYDVLADEAKKVRGKGATTFHPGKGGYYSSDLWNSKNIPCEAYSGEYLKGGNAVSTAGGSAGGGGSGYFGGGGGADLGGGGGGSSYASPDLYNVILLGGDKAFDSPDSVREVGHSNDGYIEIVEYYPYTFVKNNNTCIEKIKFVCTNCSHYTQNYLSILYLGFWSLIS